MNAEFMNETADGDAPAGSGAKPGIFGALSAVMTSILAGLAMVSSIAWGGFLELGAIGVVVTAATIVLSLASVAIAVRKSGELGSRAVFAVTSILGALTLFYSLGSLMVATGLLDVPTLTLGLDWSSGDASYPTGTAATFKLPIGEALERLASDEGYYLI